MIKNKIIALPQVKTVSLVQFGTLLALAMAAPLIGHQSITGTLVNAVLFLAASHLGLKAALAIAVLPSLFAFAVGTLPAPLAIFIPFIIAGNVLLCLTFAQLKNKGWGLAIISSSFIKFLFLLSWSQLIFGLMMPAKLAPPLLMMMSWPQLYTALLGGMTAWVVVKLVRR